MERTILPYEETEVYNSMYSENKELNTQMFLSGFNKENPEPYFKKELIVIKN